MKLRKFTVISLFVLSPFYALFAQQYDWKAGFLGFFDDREYDNIYAYDQTMFGSRLRAEAGARIDDHNRFAAGIDYLYEFGSKGELIAPDVVMYFNGSVNRFSYAFGALPRYGRINMPLSLLTDTLNYYRPNIEGIYLSYNGDILKQNLWIDWTGRRSETTRESFTIGLSGCLDKGLFVYRHHLVLNHLAHTEPKDPNASLRDNMGYSVMAGVNLSPLTEMDTLTFTAGILGSTDRLRGVYDFRAPVGLIGEAEARFRGFGLHGVVYKGDEQYITSGDESFKAGSYTRADAYYQVNRGFLESRLQFSYQVMPKATEMSFIFVLRVNIGGDFGHGTGN